MAEKGNRDENKYVARNEALWFVVASALSDKDNLALSVCDSDVMTNKISGSPGVHSECSCWIVDGWTS
jgi:hypothetical protein